MPQKYAILVFLLNGMSYFVFRCKGSIFFDICKYFKTFFVFILAYVVKKQYLCGVFRREAL